MEALNYKIHHVNYDEGEIIFKNGAELDKVYILASGEVEVYVSTADEDLILDTFRENGCIMGQFTILDLQTVVTYSARTISPVTMLELDVSKIEQCAELHKDLKTTIIRIKDQLQRQGYPTLDYQINRKSPKVGALLEETKFEGLKLFVCAVNKLLKYKKYQRKKQFKFNDLIAYLKRENAEKTNMSSEDQKKMIESLTPVIKARMNRLVT